MKRPTERAQPEVVELTDAEAPDFLERHRVALLAFLDLADPASLRLRGRLGLVGARRMRPDAPRELGVGVLDVARERGVAEALGVREIPAIVVFVKGEVEDRLSGSVPESVLDEVVASRLET